MEGNIKIDAQLRKGELGLYPERGFFKQFKENLRKFCSTWRADMSLQAVFSTSQTLIIRAVKKNLGDLGFSGRQVQKCISRFDLCATEHGEEPESAVVCNPRADSHFITLL